MLTSSLSSGKESMTIGRFSDIGSSLLGGVASYRCLAHGTGGRRSSASPPRIGAAEPRNVQSPHRLEIRVFVANAFPRNRLLRPQALVGPLLTPTLWAYQPEALRSQSGDLFEEFGRLESFRFSIVLGGRVHRNTNDFGNAVEVRIAGKEGRAVSASDGSDHAVDHAARGHSDSPAGSVDASRCIEVHRGIEPQQTEATKQSTEVLLAGSATRPGDDLHDDGLGDGDVVFGSDEPSETLVDRAFCCPIELHPRRGVDQDHPRFAGAVSSGTSSSAPAPRMASASSRVIGWPAR